MTSKERLRRAYFHEEMDRPGVYSRTGFPPNDATYDAPKAYLGAHSDLKHYWPARGVESPLPVTHFKEPYSEDFERHVAILHTPRGDLRSSVLVGLKGQPGLHETYYVNTREDAERFLSVPLPAVGGEVSPYFDAVRKMGERGIVEAGLQSNPAGAAVELCGSESFAVLSVTERDLVHALCEREMKILLKTTACLLSQGVGPFFAMLGEEYIVPPLHGPRDFADFNVRYDKPILDLIHEAGGRIHIHCHGPVKKVFGCFLDMGTDVLHPFEPPPMGDITPSEAKEMARGRMTLEGNIQISEMYESSPDRIREKTCRLIAELFADRKGLIVAPTASPYIFGRGRDCFEQYKAMVDTVLAFR
jgi:hypothetical protein